jgi:hypothetical protein
VVSLATAANSHDARLEFRPRRLLALYRHGGIVSIVAGMVAPVIGTDHWLVP